MNDIEKTALCEAVVVSKEYRGKGLVGLIHRICKYRVIEMGLTYAFSNLVTPETMGIIKNVNGIEVLM